MSLINLNQLNIIDSVSITPDGSIPVAVQFGDNLWSGNYPGGILVSKGDTSERFSSPTDGYIRYNTDLSEFEGFTNSAWRPIGQLTQDGSASFPMRSFISDETTGSFLISSGNYGIASSGDLRVQVTPTQLIAIDTFSVDSTVSGSATTSKIVSSNTETGSLIWADGADKAFIRYNHATDVFEISGSNPDLSFFIDNATNIMTIESPLNIGGPMSFDSSFGPSAVADAIFTATGGFNFILDDDDDDTTSIFKIQKHAAVDTGFEINQLGEVQAGDGSDSDPAYTFDSSPTTGFYLRTNLFTALAATFEGNDKLYITNLTSTFFNDLRIADGTEALPGLAFSGDSDSGMFRPGDDIIAFSTDGTERFRIDNSGVTIAVPTLFPDGSEGAPSISFSADTDTGIFRSDTDEIGFSADATTRFSISPTALTATVPIVAPVGSAGAPSYTFAGDTVTGIYHSASNEVSISTDSTQRVEVSNAATTINNSLIYEGGLFAGSGVCDMETTTTQIAALLANQTDTAIAAPLTYTGTTFDAVIVDYLVQRDVGSSVGTLYIVNDGTDVSITDTSANVNNTGITFTATITANLVEVKYTSTAGNGATMKYVIRRWGII